MKIERDERRFNFHGIGLAMKRAREASGMTQEQLGYIVDRDPRTFLHVVQMSTLPKLQYSELPKRSILNRTHRFPIVHPIQ